MRHLYPLVFWSLAVFTALGLSAQADELQPVHVPLEIWQNTNGATKANLSIGIGNMQPVPFLFDTGSAGLHVFSTTRLDTSPGSGIRCTNTPTHVTYGNPATIVYKGVICYAILHIGSLSSSQLVPFAYLTEAVCPDTRPNCRHLDISKLTRNHGYGIIGPGLHSKDLPNPIRTLPGRYGEMYSIVLSPERGELILGSSVPSNAVVFPQTQVRTAGPDGVLQWEKGDTCLFVNGQATGTCLKTSFDTGNGIPFIHTITDSLIPQSDGLVTPSTRIGFAPEGSTQEAVSIDAGTYKIKVAQASNNNAVIFNAGIEPFFHHIVTYDVVHGTISFAPANE